MLPFAAAGGGVPSLTDTTSQSLNTGPVSTGTKYFGGAGNPLLASRANDELIKTALIVGGLAFVVLGGAKLLRG